MIKPKGPLVIAPTANRDWRELARRRRGQQYVPPGAAATTGADGSAGGLGTRDTINSGPVLIGLQVKQRTVKLESDTVEIKEEEESTAMAVDDETEDQKALRAVLASADGRTEEDGPVIDVIRPSEADALKQDVEELPEEATLADYERVPVAQFGAALLRGMGWKEGMAASRKPGRGMVEPYMPEARPALLGIGAKEQEVYDDGSKKAAYKKRPDKRYVPVLKKEREGSQAKGDSREDRDSRGDRERRRDRSYSPRRSIRDDRRDSRYDDKYREREDTYRDRDDKYRDRDDKYRGRDYGRDDSRRREKDDGRDRTKRVDDGRERADERSYSKRADDGRDGRKRTDDGRTRTDDGRESTRRRRDY